LTYRAWVHNTAVPSDAILTIFAGPYGSSKAAVHALTETLTVELAQFNIRVLLVQPSAFRTRMVRAEENYNTGNPIAAYDDTRRENLHFYASRDGKQPGDPDKAMEAVVDVVRGEGAAQGKPWPGYLLLGKEADRDVRAKCRRMTEHLDEWSDVVNAVDFE
jgi:NAD(P)-dependent dehydrogenase (short-subunit alcohol dehydrogenase family)